MKIYLKSIVNQLRNYSETLDKTSILIDKPWSLIDDEFEIQKLIFKSNNQLILSKNGQVQIGRWEYLAGAKSLLIDRITDKILCNEAFIDKGVLILKLDGTNNKFFILANENIIPDLDYNRYLKELRYQKLKISERRVSNGKILEIQREHMFQEPQIGHAVSVEAETIDDGKYQLEEQENTFYEIQNGKIIYILTETKYSNPEGVEIFIQQQYSWYIRNGDYVYVLGELVGSTTINFTKTKNLVVRDGRVVRLERKNAITRWLSKGWKITLGDYNR